MANIERKTITIKITGWSDHLDKMVEALKDRGAIDIQTPGGHGRNREIYPNLSARVVPDAD